MQYHLLFLKTYNDYIIQQTKVNRNTMAQQHIRLDNGLTYFRRETQDGSLEIRAIGLAETLAAVQDLNQQGYSVMLDPTDTPHWPIPAGRTGIFFAQKQEGKVDDLTKDSTKEEDQEVQEGGIDSEGEVLSEGDDASAELEAPDWKEISKMSKQEIEDHADLYSIQLTTDKSKAKMVEAFKAAYNG